MSSVRALPPFRWRNRTTRIGRALSGFARSPAGVAALYWAAVVSVDVVNDWLLAGLAGAERPLSRVLLNAGRWWILWLVATPLLLRVARVLDPRRIGWATCLVLQLAVTVAAVSVHTVATAMIFELVDAYPGGLTARILYFGRVFTLTQVLTYWGFLGVVHAAREGRRGAEPADRTTADDGPDAAAAADVEQPLRRFVVRTGDRARFVPIEEVDWLEADGNYVRLHVGPSYHLMRASLSGTVRRLDGRFIRIHRSLAVNVDRLRELVPAAGGDARAVLVDGRELPVSRTYRPELLAADG